MSDPLPPTALQFVLAVLSIFLFATAVIEKRLGTRNSHELQSHRSRWSLAGIVIQSLGFVIVGVGHVVPAGNSLAPTSLALSLVVLCAGLGGILLFRASARALGANWSLVARTRADHSLTTKGPFARIRHPIYAAMLLLLVAIAVGFSHFLALLIAIPVFLVGTAIRVREEEKLLIGKFGDAYRAYARKTPAFIPHLHGGGPPA